MNVMADIERPADANASNPLLQVNSLTTELLTRAGPRKVVDRLSFDVHAGEVLAIIGESGSGKSVAMQSLLGLLPSPPGLVTTGTALFEGRDLLRLPATDLRTLRGNRIGMIFQEPMSALNPVTRIGDQIAETLVTHRGMTWSAARAEAVRLLDRVRITDAPARAQLTPSALSGGMRQRVVIAAAIACKPALIVADEPTTALDATVQAEILELLRELQREMNCAVILITHDMAVVRQIADRVLVMQRGQALESGKTADVLAAPRADYTRTLIAATLPATTSPRALPAGHAERPPPLAVEDLVISFPRNTSLISFAEEERLFAVDGVSLTVHEGETLAFVGESGSGKTTLARAILGLTRIDAGRVRLSGEDIAANPAAARGKVQFVFQDPQASLDPRYRAWQSVMEPLLLAGERDKTRLRARAADLLGQVGLDAGYLDRFTHELSGGQRQRLGIARALSVSPKLVIADEAVSALDATTRLQVLELFQAIQRDTALPFLFITHDFAVVTRIAHRVAVMRFGRLVEIGPTEAIMRHPQHPYTRALIASAEGAVSVTPRSRGHRIGKLDSQRSWVPLRDLGDGHFVAGEET
jgi:peptide/nickel transport system ATP-binding protein